MHVHDDTKPKKDAVSQKLTIIDHNNNQIDPPLHISSPKDEEHRKKISMVCY